MKLGIMLGAVPGPEARIDTLLDRARDVEARGFASLWMAHIRGHDAVMAMALAGRETQRIEVGTAVTPVQPRHPVALAQQALSAAAIAGGRFSLGIGLSHKVVIEDMLGLSWARPARTMADYLDVLAPLLAGAAAEAANDHHRVAMGLDVADAATPVPLLVAALGPRMLEIAGRRTDGTILWMTGPKTIRDHVVPALAAAAGAAGHPTPRAIAGFPVVLTNDAAGTREKVGQLLKVYGRLPSYRAMLDREGLAGPADLALVGDEAELRAALTRIREAGASDLIAVLPDTEDGAAARTLDFLQSCL